MEVETPDVNSAKIFDGNCVAQPGAQILEELPNNSPVQVESNIPDVSLEKVQAVSENVVLFPDWLKIHDSEENLFITQKPVEVVPKAKCVKSELKNKPPLSDSLLVTSKPIHTSGFSKILHWDPWQKISRKNKKDKNKKKQAKQKMKVEVLDCSDGLKSNISPDISCLEETNETNLNNPFELEANIGEYPESQYSKKMQKAVRFQTNVKVIYYASDQILGHAIEPLKKELEQQERNKELRKEFSPETVSGLKCSIRKSASDYMSSWYKRK